MSLRKNTLIYAPFGNWELHLAADMELAVSELEAGNKVTVLLCNGNTLPCDLNQQQNPLICQVCFWNTKKQFLSLKRQYQELQIEVLPTFAPDSLAPLVKYSSADELLKAEIDGYPVGRAVLSTLICHQRNASLSLEELSALSVDAQIAKSLLMHRFFIEFLKEKHFDRVFLFNGRFFSHRPLLEACKALRIDYFTHDRGCDLHHYALYQNTLPHDRHTFQQNALRLWNQANEEERIAVAKKWYTDRIDRKLQNFFVFAANQNIGVVPDDFQKFSRNVVLFSSSEDEFVCIEGWEGVLFEKQVDAINAVIDILSNDPATHIWIRHHPNLSTAQYETFLRTIRTSECVTHCPPSSPWDSYSLASKADLVIVYGSTIGVEACFLGKPVINLGPSFYDDLGAAYNPSTKHQLHALLSSPLEPLPVNGALIYGYYSAVFGTRFKHFTPTSVVAGVWDGKAMSPRMFRPKLFAMHAEAQKHSPDKSRLSE